MTTDKLTLGYINTNNGIKVITLYTEVPGDANRDFVTEYTLITHADGAVTFSVRVIKTIQMRQDKGTLLDMDLTEDLRSQMEIQKGNLSVITEIYL